MSRANKEISRRQVLGAFGGASALALVPREVAAQIPLQAPPPTPAAFDVVGPPGGQQTLVMETPGLSGGNVDPFTTTLGPFGILAVMLDDVAIKRGVVTTTDFYILDTGADGGSGVVLNVYRRIDQAMNDGVSTTVGQVAAISIPQLSGGAGVDAFMAGSASYVAIGTTDSPAAIRFDKRSFETLIMSPSADASGNVTSVTAGAAGAVAVSIGNVLDLFLKDNTTGTPDGSIGMGRGQGFVVGTQNGIRLQSTTPGTGPAPLRSLSDSPSAKPI